MQIKETICEHWEQMLKPKEINGTKIHWQPFHDPHSMNSWALTYQTIYLVIQYKTNANFAKFNATFNKR
jgi:hypothetical protein